MRRPSHLAHRDALRLARPTGERGSEVTAHAGLAAVVHGLVDHDAARDQVEAEMRPSESGVYRIIEGEAVLISAELHTAGGPSAVAR